MYPRLNTSVPQTITRGGTPAYRGEGGIKRRLLAHEDYSNISNCRTKIVTIFIIFCGISKQLRIDSTISLGTLNDALWNPKVPRNPVLETLVYTHTTNRRYKILATERRLNTTSLFLSEFVSLTGAQA